MSRGLASQGPLNQAEWEQVRSVCFVLEISRTRRRVEQRARDRRAAEYHADLDPILTLRLSILRSVLIRSRMAGET